MPVINNDGLLEDLSLENLISPIGSDSSKQNHEIDDDFIQSKNEVDTLNHFYNSLQDNYDNTEKKLNEAFESLRVGLEKRKSTLLNELKHFYEERKTSIATHPDVRNLPMEKFDFVTSSSSDTTNNKFHIAPLKMATNHVNSLNNLINTYGKIVRIESCESPLECTIEGKGLTKCNVNEVSSFTLTFKNRTEIATSNVSFLDIYIITSDGNTYSTHNRNIASSTTLSTRTNSSRALSSSHSNGIGGAGTARSTKYSKTANCDCTLEVLAEGVYAVKYKLAKKGIYTMNILVNKKHIGQSPYKLVCLEGVKKNELTKTSMRNVKTSSVANMRSSHSALINGDHFKTNKMKTEPKTTNLVKNLYNTKSTSSTSLLLPSNNSYSPRSVTPSLNSNMSKSKQYFSTIFNGTTSSNNHQNTKHQNMINSNPHNMSHDDSVMSSAQSVLSDSLSSPISPALSKTNISSYLMNDLSNNGSSKQEGLEDDFLFQIGRRGRAHSEFMNPQAVCATAEYIYVTDSNNQKIEAFSHNGEYKFTMGSSPTAKIIRRPIGIDSNLEGKILCVDYEYKCVNVFEESGKFLTKICQNKLLGPKGISINKANQNQIVIADSKANSVCIFDSDGKFLQRFGNLGNKNENFAGPQYLSCMSNGDIVVTDFYNHCIKVYDCEGKFRFSFGSNGSDQGQFNGPTGISTDSKDNIIVVDWGNSRIQVFDKHGNFQRFIKSECNQLYGPQDVAIINNTIAVADSGNHCVKIFEYS